MKIRIILILSIPVLLYGCSQTSDKGLGNGTAWAVGSFDSNGKQIYLNSTSQRGTPITYTGGPVMGMMMTGGNLACASCHGIDGKGGKHVMHMEVMDSPDIRWSALANHHHEEGAGKEMEQNHNEAYTLGSFKNSVENGKHPDGDVVSRDMPRWKMSDADLKDLMDYLKSLQ